MIARLDEALQHNRRFLADASHELRTPLTILHGGLETMIRWEGLSLEMQGALANMLEEVERLVRIVETLIALSRIETGSAHAEHTQIDLSQLAAATTDQMALLAEDKRQQLSFHVPAPVLVEGDRSRLKQVIVNLLDNAIKYTPQGGRVQLTVKTSLNEAVCEVSDTGVGIPAEAIPRIFDRFYRVDAARSREGGGAGIGLSIVKVICAAHGGRVEVESEVGKGSCFRACLPLAGGSFLPPKA